MTLSCAESDASKSAAIAVVRFYLRTSVRHYYFTKWAARLSNYNVFLLHALRYEICETDACNSAAIAVVKFHLHTFMRHYSFTKLAARLSKYNVFVLHSWHYQMC